jgi:lipopolysaccharide export system permease protein
MLIERYVTAEIVRPFAAGLGMLAVVFMAFSTAVRLSEAASGQIPPDAVLQLILLSTLIAFEVLIPTTLYLAILFAIGRLHRDSEMAALAAAGVGEQRILRPVLLLGLGCGVLVALLSLYGRPWAYAKSYALEQETMSHLDLEKIRPGSFVDLGSDGYVLQARAVDIGESELQDVFVQVDRGRHAQLISAERARIHDLDDEGSRAVEFFDGYSYFLDREGRQDAQMAFGSFVVRFPPEERIQRFRRKAVDTATLGDSELPKDRAEYQWRTTTPLATILLALLAVPLARSSPRQSRFGIFAIALLAYLMIFICSGMVRSWIENGEIPPFPGLILAYVPGALLLALLLAAPRLRARRARK